MTRYRIDDEKAPVREIQRYLLELSYADPQRKSSAKPGLSIIRHGNAFTQGSWRPKTTEQEKTPSPIQRNLICVSGTPVLLS